MCCRVERELCVRSWLAREVRFPVAGLVTNLQIQPPARTRPAAMDAKIAQFCQVTGCADPAKARFFLESSNGEIDAAISAFFGASPRLPAAQI